MYLSFHREIVFCLAGSAFAFLESQKREGKRKKEMS